jgi:hypothetical protein
MRDGMMVQVRTRSAKKLVQQKRDDVVQRATTPPSGTMTSDAQDEPETGERSEVDLVFPAFHHHHHQHQHTDATGDGGAGLVPSKNRVGFDADDVPPKRTVLKATRAPATATRDDVADAEEIESVPLADASPQPARAAPDERPGRAPAGADLGVGPDRSMDRLSRMRAQLDRAEEVYHASPKGRHGLEQQRRALVHQQMQEEQKSLAARAVQGVADGARAALFGAGHPPVLPHKAQIATDNAM